jgi:hypothetical protein
MSEAAELEKPKKYCGECRDSRLKNDSIEFTAAYAMQNRQSNIEKYCLFFLIHIVCRFLFSNVL